MLRITAFIANSNTSTSNSIGCARSIHYESVNKVVMCFYNFLHGDLSPHDITYQS